MHVLSSFFILPRWEKERSPSQLVTGKVRNIHKATLDLGKLIQDQTLIFDFSISGGDLSECLCDRFELQNLTG